MQPISNKIGKDPSLFDLWSLQHPSLHATMLYFQLPTDLPLLTTEWQIMNHFLLCLISKITKTNILAISSRQKDLWLRPSTSLSRTPKILSSILNVSSQGFSLFFSLYFMILFFLLFHFEGWLEVSVGPLYWSDSMKKTCENKEKKEKSKWWRGKRKVEKSFEKEREEIDGVTFSFLFLKQ
jgi:hypothetical protein